MAVNFAQWGNDLYTGRRSYKIVGHRRRWFLIVAVLGLASLVVLLTQGFNLGIDFRGGSEFDVSAVSNPTEQPAIDAVRSISPTDQPQVTVVGQNGIRVQTTQFTNPADVTAMSQALADAYGVSTDNVTSTIIGPTWGAGVSQRALEGVIVFVVIVAVIMALYFRAWRMSVAAIIALFADLLLAVGVYSAVGWEVTPSTIIGFLTILGYSLYDKVVVFDKVRENTHNVLDQSYATYAEQANLAVNQTLVRSINTGVVAILPVAGILFVGAFLLGAGTLRDISLALFVGILVGTLSSIFLATPLQVWLREREPKIAAHTKRVLAARVSAVTVEGSVATVDATAAGFVGPLRPGSHQGFASQPKRQQRRGR
ncbi:MAG: protein translocase subunit SecF [Micrococcales bacterium]|nr:protein translocase subunit SecF [Micrococcales bacterium]